MVGIWFPPWLSAKPDARGEPRDGPAKAECKAFEIAKAEKRRQNRWRSTIVEGRAGESPPGIVKELIMNNIGSAARSRLPARGRLQTREIKAVFGLMLPLCLEVEQLAPQEQSVSGGVEIGGRAESRPAESKSPEIRRVRREMNSE
ncbi:MAG: hypothetical protein K0B15_00660 [Lentimicrobium sp.]|nr:hypothetical protein [Lentimicrobium sp.]